MTAIYNVQPSASKEDDSIPFLVLKECFLPLSPGVPEEKLKRGIQSLEANLETLIQLPAHSNIMRPLGFLIQRMPPDVPMLGGWQIRVLMDLASRGSLKDLLETAGSVNANNARAWANQIIEGLDFYHRHGIVHGALRPENVLLERRVSGTAIVLLSDGLFQNELHTMMREPEAKFVTAASAHWTAPEVVTDMDAKRLGSRDIWDLGILLAQMVLGLDVQRLHASPMTMVEASSFSRSLEDLFMKVFKADPRKRPAAFDLLPDEFLRSDDPIFDNGSGDLLSSVSSPYSTAPAKHVRPRHDSANLAPSASRYANDFVEAGRLGKGGFGEVVRARNKLDGRFYAIKKITQSSAAALSPVLSEIILLSRLSHVNVVRYYTAWIEEERQMDTVNGLSGSEASQSSVTSNIETSIVDFGHSAPGLDFVSSSGYPKIEFGYGSDDESQDSEAIDDDDTDGDQSQGIAPTTSGEVTNSVSPTSSRAHRRRSSVVLSRKTLYIQMEYCERQVCSVTLLRTIV